MQRKQVIQVSGVETLPLNTDAVDTFSLLRKKNLTYKPWEYLVPRIRIRLLYLTPVFAKGLFRNNIYVVYVEHLPSETNDDRILAQCASYLKLNWESKVWTLDNVCLFTFCT